MKQWALVLVAGTLVWAACGSTTDTAAVASLDDIDVDAANPSDDAAVDTEGAMLAMAECLREHGVEVADPEVDETGNVLPPRPVEPDSVDREAMRTAREACSEFLDGVEFGFQNIDRTELEDTLLDYAVCIRSNGYDMPDPDLDAAGDGPGQVRGAFGEIDQSDPDFVAAREQCQDILGGFGPEAGGRGLGPGPGGGS